MACLWLEKARARRLNLMLKWLIIRQFHWLTMRLDLQIPNGLVLDDESDSLILFTNSQALIALLNLGSGVVIQFCQTVSVQILMILFLIVLRLFRVLRFQLFILFSLQKRSLRIEKSFRALNDRLEFVLVTELLGGTHLLLSDSRHFLNNLMRVHLLLRLLPITLILPILKRSPENKLMLMPWLLLTLHQTVIIIVYEFSFHPLQLTLLFWHSDGLSSHLLSWLHLEWLGWKTLVVGLLEGFPLGNYELFVLDLHFNSTDFLL